MFVQLRPNLTSAYVTKRRYQRQSVAFGATVDEKLAAYQTWLSKTHLPLLKPQDQREPLGILKKVLALRKAPSSQITLKQPGDYVFVTWNDQGFADRSVKPMVGLENNPKGFFWSDMRYIDHFMIYGPQGSPLVLDSKAVLDASASFSYRVEGHPDLHIKRTDQLEAHHLYQDLAFENQSNHEATFTVEVGSLAEDIFIARGADEKSGPLTNANTLLSKGNAVVTTFSTNPTQTAPKPENVINAIVHLRTSDTKHIRLQSGLKEGKPVIQISVTVPPHQTIQVPLAMQSNNLSTELVYPLSAFSEEDWDKAMPTLSFSSPTLQTTFNTALTDLKRLTIPVQCGQKTYFPLAAGIPNFMALFGRDSIITSMQILPFYPNAAREALYVLSYFQGDGYDAFREMEPGKILHERRYGEMTRLDISPHSPYYGTMDATPLFMMLFEKYLKRTGDLKAMQDLWPNFERALDWVDTHVISDPKNPLCGFLAQRDSGQIASGKLGLKNIGWKDSGSAMTHLMDSDGTLKDPRYPIAPAEVQAYIYGAWEAAAWLYQHYASYLPAHSPKRQVFISKAEQYQHKADALKTAFNQKYWMPDKHFMAIALQADGSPLPSVSSNGVQTLLTGIVDQDKAQKMVSRLMKPDMLSGWGIRTLSSEEKAFDPLSYQNGSVWPHDNSLMVLGLKRYGFDEQAKQVSEQVLQAASTFPECRLPELYGGFTREKDDTEVVPYPDTCMPQAWASGAPLALLSALLGLEIDQSQKQVILNHPVLPDGLQSLEIHKLMVTPNYFVNLQVSRGADNTIHVKQSPCKSPKLSLT